MVSGANEVCMVMGPNAFKALPACRGSLPAPQHTAAGDGEGAMNTQEHRYLL